MKTSDLTVEELYAAIWEKSGNKYNRRFVDQLVEYFRQSAVYLVHRIETENWKWRDNYLREHAGCAYRAKFTNTVSPYVLEMFFRRNPQYQKYRNDDDDPLL